MSQNTIAIICDCDETLTQDTTSLLLESNGIDIASFWNNACNISLDEQFNPVNYQDDTFHASYILAMIKSVIGNDPIDYS